MRSIWGISYIKRKMYERAAKKKEETPSDKSARVTATATKWMAVFTLLLFLVTGGTLIILKNQLQEMRGSGTQTDKIINAANLIEDHQKQMMTDNKQALEDNRNALNASLKENRTELSKVLGQNREALKLSGEQSKAALDATIKAAGEQSALMNAQLVAVQKQTEVSERPWLSVEVTSENGMQFVNGEQAVVALKLTIKNVGKSIAKQVQADAKLFPTSAGMPFALDAATHQRELCDHPTIAPLGTFDVFPTDHPVERVLDISAIPPTIAAAQLVIAGTSPRRFVGFYVVGCVSYRYSFGTEFHQTRFAYHLIGPRTPSPNGGFLILSDGTLLIEGFEVGVNVPKDKMGLVQELFSRNDAN